MSWNPLGNFFFLSRLHIDDRMCTWNHSNSWNVPNGGRVRSPTAACLWMSKQMTKDTSMAAQNNEKIQINRRRNRLFLILFSFLQSAKFQSGETASRSPLLKWTGWHTKDKTWCCGSCLTTLDSLRPPPPPKCTQRHPYMDKPGNATPLGVPNNAN